MIDFLLWDWSNFKEEASLTLWGGVRTLFYSINSYIYRLIIELYDVFMALCHGKLLDSNALNALFGRIGVILGLVMFMYVAFSFVKVLIDPDSFNDKQKGIPNIIKKIIIVIVMLGISSYVFTLLNNIQSAIIKNNVISNLIMPSNIKTDDFGSLLSSQLFLSFYSFKDNVEANDDDISEWCKEDNNAVVKLQESIVNNQNFDIGLDCLNAHGEVNNYIGEGDKEDFLIDYNFVFCLIIGVIVCYLLLTYCISVGIRMIQLAVLQIISPMAIVSYLSPKQDNMFSKWTKIYISTYIDVFIRIAIINFMVYLSGFVLDAWNNRDNVFWTSVGGNAGFKSYVIGILMILALLSFAKKAPELIKDLFPQSASKIGFGMKSPKHFFDDVLGAGLVKKAPGQAKKAVGYMRDRNQRRKELEKSLPDGASMPGMFENLNSRLRNNLGLQTEADRLDVEKEKLENENKAYKEYDSYVSAAEDRAEKQILKGKFNNDSSAKAALLARNKAEILRAQAGNLKVSDFKNEADYRARVAKLNNDAIALDQMYNEKLKEAKANYINAAINDSEFDAAVSNNISMATSVASMNSDYEGFSGFTGSFDDYASMDTVNNTAKSQTTSNTIKIQENMSQGQRARAVNSYNKRGK